MQNKNKLLWTAALLFVASAAFAETNPMTDVAVDVAKDAAKSAAPKEVVKGVEVVEKVKAGLDKADALKAQTESVTTDPVGQAGSAAADAAKTSVSDTAKQAVTETAPAAEAATATADKAMPAQAAPAATAAPKNKAHKKSSKKKQH